MHRQARYRNSTKGQRDSRNTVDQFYRNGGSQMLLALKGDATKGFTATFDIGLNIG